MRLALTVFFIILVALIPETKPAPVLNFQAGFFERALAPGVVETPEEFMYTGITFLGDVLLARRIETLLDRYGSDYVYRRLTDFSTSSQYVVANFESAVPHDHRHTPDLTFRFSTDAVHLNALHTFGVNHVSLANNHSYDAGTLGFAETYANIAAAGMVPFGDQRIGSATVALTTINGQSIAIAALYALDIEPDYTALARQLEQFASTTPAIAYVHWGTEYAPLHSPAQRRVAERLVALGFAAIIGHHPHVVQDIQLIDDVPVFYSLGNFIFDQYFSVSVQQGLTVALTPMPDVWEFQLVPVTAYDAQSQPRLMNAAERAEFLTMLAAKSSPELRADIQNGVVIIPQ